MILFSDYGVRVRRTIVFGFLSEVALQIGAWDWLHSGQVWSPKEYIACFTWIVVF